jgi:hypothetical protein
VSTLASRCAKLPGEQKAKAFVVFVGQADSVWLRWLRPGFRHCFVLLHDGERWISIDPLLTHMDVQVHSVPPDFDMDAWLEDRGHTVIQAELCRSHEHPAPFMVFTCVEAVKRVLGLHDWRVVTPWQLYRRLVMAEAQP